MITKGNKNLPRTAKIRSFELNRHCPTIRGPCKIGSPPGHAPCSKFRCITLMLAGQIGARGKIRTCTGDAIEVLLGQNGRPVRADSPTRCAEFRNAPARSNDALSLLFGMCEHYLTAASCSSQERSRLLAFSRSVTPNRDFQFFALAPDRTESPIQSAGDFVVRSGAQQGRFRRRPALAG